MKEQKTKRKFFAPPKVQRKRFEVTGQWKPMDIDPSIFGEADLGGLICFEELTDYESVSTVKGAEKKTKKRQLEVSLDSSSPKKLKTSGNDSPISPQTKKKKKKKNATDQHLKNVEDVDCFSEDVNEIERLVKNNQGVRETNNGSIAPQKKKKRKKKKSATSQQKELPRPPNSGKKVKNWTAANQSQSLNQSADVSAWKDLFVPEPVLSALSSLGYSAPTPIQALVLPPAIRDKMDILGAAETGSGKTLAFAIPMINIILEWREAKETKLKRGEEVPDSNQDNSKNDNQDPISDDVLECAGEEQEEVEVNESEDEHGSPKLGCVKVINNAAIDFEVDAVCNDENPLMGLVLTPTRELAVQVKHHIDAVAKFTGIRTAILVGGMAPQKQERVLSRKPEIVIATPGRLWDLIKEKHPHLSHLRQLRCLVIDEADRMVEKGHFAELTELLELLNNKEYHPKRRIFVFSATLTMVHQAPSRILSKKHGKNIDKDTKLEILMQKIGMRTKPKVIDLTRKEGTVETLTETRIQCQAEEKDFYLYYFLLQYPGRTMVFANSIDCIRRLNGLLTHLECNPLPLHANMHQKQRLKNLERFAERESCVLLTTDVAARGLDIPNVQHVFHYQIPRTTETYVHRSGRTARASKAGLALMMVGPSDLLFFKKICKALGKDESIPFFPVQLKCMSAIKARVNTARSIEKMEYQYNKAQQHNSWFQQAAEALEVDLDDDVLMGGKHDEADEKQRQRMLKGMKKELKHMLSQPVFKNCLMTRYPTQMGRLILPDLPVATQESALSTIIKHKKKQPLHKKAKC
ncbi:ATP-dependent RNA helicase DDX24 [Callorhinchus milii]|uniref:ATP-dependent RNA helicase n=1 Tax=Callorhinchus milii TaxID=7868 RepID=A0A4W3GX39_CALMI|nr:ATP-dependent RNA helicase DDX24 [Callorhinchus milii]XP_007902064.1 ATP-dependent RNA helicase DDX24 [Callorhinchus milii]XP_007902065.1 ATP-dependent RNA helicase DDX24 [Callorhinchus milii]XP_007902067.1 ATP-dependent RNA helicase DDX24 [Callorhinchus milii]|eukprot:gi/632971218/ref/XP_007902063.1/ PREDICTED: ATP-dependent RNA helicase DDX24 [Callorhinchus milii]